MTSLKAVDEIIRAAIERGEFNNLTGEGKPLDLSEYFNTPEDLRLTYSILKNAGIPPVEIENLNEINRLNFELKDCSDEIRRKQIYKRINDLSMNFRILIERIHNQPSKSK